MADGDFNDLSVESSRNNFGLQKAFADKLQIVLDNCRAAGYEFRISQGLRSPQKQALYYCQWAKRSPSDIDAKVDELIANGAPWIAGLLKALRDTRRQPSWQTNALPGAGWHQWGEAADCYCYRDGVMVEAGDDSCYAVYAKIATAAGLTPGLYFSTPDAGHVQLRPQGGASSLYSWAEIDRVMRERFSEKPTLVFSKALTTDLAGEIAGASTKFLKDDPSLSGESLRPARSYATPLPTHTVAGRMAATYNDVGGLIEALSTLLSVDPVAVLAVWYVESGGLPFIAGKPVLRFENHQFYKHWGAKNVAAFDEHFQFGGHAGVPGKAYTNHRVRLATGTAWTPFHGHQDAEYEVFNLAARLAGAEAACLSASFGGPQIMGFNHDACGYATAQALYSAFGADPRWQVLGFFDFCKSKGLIYDIKLQRWEDFGGTYNGDATIYGENLRKAFASKSELLQLPKA